MAYSSGMLNKRITIATRAEDKQEFGKQGQARYTILGQFWAAEDFNRGVKSLREGAMDAYDTVMFRLRYHECIDRWCVIQYEGRWYQIQSFHPDEQANTIQITATEMANNPTIIE
jgi:SPP1 family predicted phage head-tail adaptor